MTTPRAGDFGNELSLSRDEAIDLGLLVAGSGARIASTVRIVPAEDDGRKFGPVEIGADAVIRDHVMLGTGTRIGSRVLIGHNCALRRNVRSAMIA